MHFPSGSCSFAPRMRLAKASPPPPASQRPRGGWRLLGRVGVKSTDPPPAPPPPTLRQEASLTRMGLHSHFQECEPRVPSPCPGQQVQLVAGMGKLRLAIPKAIKLPNAAAEGPSQMQGPLASHWGR